MVRFSSMNKDMENIKTIESLEKEIWNLKKKIDLLNEELQLVEIVEKQHKELNGKLRLEITRLKGGL